MKRVWIAVIAWIVSVMVVGAPGIAQAGVHQVWDEAHLFKAETLLDVDPILQEIDAKFFKDLMIETFPSIPDDFKSMYTKDGEDAFYERWSVTEGRAVKVNGILVLITRQPRHLNVYVGLDTRNKAFTLDDRVELLAIFTNAFRQGNYDEGLMNGVKFVRDRMARNLTPPPATQPTSQPASNPATTQPGDFSK